MCVCMCVVVELVGVCGVCARVGAVFVRVCRVTFQAGIRCKVAIRFSILRQIYEIIFILFSSVTDTPYPHSMHLSTIGLAAGSILRFSMCACWCWLLTDFDQPMKMLRKGCTTN